LDRPPDFERAVTPVSIAQWRDDDYDVEDGVIVGRIVLVRCAGEPPLDVGERP
jgi:hypothetical protein